MLLRHYICKVAVSGFVLIVVSNAATREQHLCLVRKRGGLFVRSASVSMERKPLDIYKSDELFLVDFILLIFNIKCISFYTVEQMCERFK